MRLSHQSEILLDFIRRTERKCDPLLGIYPMAFCSTECHSLTQELDLLRSLLYTHTHTHTHTHTPCQELIWCYKCSGNICGMHGLINMQNEIGTKIFTATILLIGNGLETSKSINRGPGKLHTNGTTG